MKKLFIILTVVLFQFSVHAQDADISNEIADDVLPETEEISDDDQIIQTESEISDSDETAVEKPVSKPENPINVTEGFYPEMFVPAKGIISINRELNAKFKVFPDLPVFIDARLYKGTKGNYKIVFLYSDEKGNLSETQAIVDEKAIENIRSAIIAKMEPPVIVDKKHENPIGNPIVESQTALLRKDMGVMAELLSVSIIYSGGWGAMMPYIFAGEDAEMKAYLSTSLIGAGIGFFAPYFALKKSNLSTGGAIGAELGGLRGTLDGFLISTLFIGLDEHNRTETRGMLGLMAGMSITEYFAGMYIAEKMKITEDRMRAITAYSFIGYLTSLELLVLAAGDDGTENNDSNKDTGMRIMGGTLLAGGIGGMISGYYLSKNTHYTSGDTVILGTTVSVVGGFPLAFISLGDDVDARVYSGVALAGTIGGVVLGDYFANIFDFKAWQSVMVDLSTIGGALLGFGFAWIIDDDIFSNIGTMTIPIAIGGAIGFASMMAVFGKDASRQRIERESSFLDNFKVTLNPYAFTAVDRKLNMSEKTAGDPLLLENCISNNPSNIILSVQYIF